jgi:protein-disulfide isomerase
VKRLLIIISTLVLTFSVSAAHFSKSETNEIQKVVHNYLINNPEILVQMSQELQQKQYQQLQNKALSAIKANSNELFNPQGSQVMGNPKGTVTLVEFFDYQCVHCSNLHKQKTIANLVASNPNLRVVTQEFPIFGAQSVYASKAAMAAAQQGKYHQMRDAIFNTGEIEGKLKDADINKAARSIGLNMKQYNKDMKRYGNSRYKDNIATVYKLAQALGIQGTPSFVIAPTPKLGNSSGKTMFIPGLVSADQMQQAITAAK